jgi:ATP-dependent helicase/nuclease subunit B
MSAARRRPRAPSVYTIAADLPFADTLAAALFGDGPLGLGRYDPLSLAQAMIFVPTRRAVRALGDAFVRLSGARATLLPRLRPFGDLDDDEAFLAGGADDLDAALAPAVSPLAREMLLLRLVEAWTLRRDGARPGADAAARLARALARFIDELDSERIDPAGLKNLAPERFAAHWQEVLAFLSIVTEEWPGVLRRLGRLDPVARRNAALERLAERWRKAPPSHPVIAAGSTGSLPAAAALIDVIARLPSGAAVLPGLDRTLDERSWEALEPSHPQFGLKRLLERLQVPRDAVVALGGPSPRAGRLALIAEALRPAATTDAWRRLPPLAPAALEGVSRAECANEEAEAGVIALKLRETLETPGKTAALVTPDRDLARRVGAALARYGVTVDDSAGRPLARTPPGAFLRLIAALAAERVAPVPLLALLKHPLSAGGLAPPEFRRRARRLERACLRGPRQAPGFVGLRAALGAAGPEPEAEGLDAWLATLEAACGPFVALVEAGAATLEALLAALLRLAEWLAASDAEAGAGRLWAGEAGEAAARFCTELGEAVAGLPAIAPAGFAAFLEVMLGGAMVRPARPRHGRLFLWGPLEARLQHADVMILGGLNEGTWPAEPEPDPWLSRPMRAALGLSPPERRIGLSAHDFAQAWGAPELLLTRARRVAGAPAVPARWLTRLDALLDLVAPGARSALDPGALQAWHAALDAPAEVTPCAPPAPRPPLSARPRRASVTEIETWLRDPYSVYARRVLRLEPLEALDADAGAAERGTLIHAVLDEFRRDHPERLPPDALERLSALGRRHFEALGHRPGVTAVWWPRFERIAAWFVATENARAELARVLATECAGRLALDLPGGSFLLTCKADRIDRLSDGQLLIIDYKTGGVPSRKEVEDGRSPQLPLEAAIALAGGFGTAIPTGAPIALEYWRLTGAAEPGKRQPVTEDAAELAARARARIEAFLARFDDAAMPFRAVPRPALAPRFNDYAQLARLGEWVVEPPR